MQTSIEIPKPAEEIIETLNSHGFEAYAVGAVFEIVSLEKSLKIGISQRQLSHKKSRPFLAEPLIQGLPMEQ